jgi:hypothetical protein
MTRLGERKSGIWMKFLKPLHAGDSYLQFEIFLAKGISIFLKV